MISEIESLYSAFLSAGKPVAIATARQVGEDRAAFLARHEAATDGEGGTILVTTFDCNGEEETVTTVLKPGESVDDFFDRHDDAVAEAKKRCDDEATA